jgi:hypothetical protein
MPDELVALDAASFDVLQNTLNTLQDQMASVLGGRAVVAPRQGNSPPACVFRVTGFKSGDYYPAVLTYHVPGATPPDNWADLTAVRVFPLNDEKLEVGRRYPGVFTGGAYQDHPVVQCGGNNSPITIDVPIEFGIDPGPPCVLYVTKYRRYVIRAGFIEVVSSSVITGP